MEEYSTLDGFDSSEPTMDNLKIDTTTTELTAALSDISNDEARTPRFDVTAVPKRWTPETDRDQRIANDGDDKFLPYDAETNPLCGGDFVLNDQGEAATISFLFVGTNGKRYGLSVAHLNPKLGMGSHLFTYTKDSMICIGNVVRFSMKTDSMIFRLNSNINADFYKIRLSDNTKHEIDLSTSGNAMKTLRSKKLSGEEDPDIFFIGRGARYRGTKGRYNSTRTNNSTENVFTDDIGIQSISIDTENEDHDTKLITHGGDCGMIVLNENGEPLSMHHAMGECEVNGVTFYGSFSVPLCRIMKAHRHFFPCLVQEEDNDNKDDDCFEIVKTSPQRASSRQIPSIPSSFFVKGRPYGLVRTGRGLEEGNYRIDISKYKFSNLTFEGSEENV